jgi:hypothetical protein
MEGFIDTNKAGVRGWREGGVEGEIGGRVGWREREVE